MPIPQDQHGCGTFPRAGISLPVLDPKRTIRRSRMGPRRAAVLIGVHVLIGIHVLHWLVYGMTVTPVEPSESMYTINLGKVNAGFVFFVLAILSTLVLGRFFCGWGCHVVALQDLCGWAMKKLGVKPKPFRSRLLVWAPMVLAVYMFAWPTIKREVIRPIVGPSVWESLTPYVGEAGVRPEIRAAFMTEDFWETFPPWYVAIPFLLSIGFACVYFLGAKGFCTYGCPYGGVFGPADLVAPGRIRVTDACEHCGHCTAVCTSNVRVHEEVRDYGMVMDPGCMKCMDCVSVCPNDALYFGFGKPALGAKPRTTTPAKFKSRVYDFTWKEELAYGAIFLAMVIGFRGMLGLVPLLMAMGLAGIGTFLLWKLVSMIRLANVRVQSVQLKLKGIIKPAGMAVGVLAASMVGTGVWGAAMNASVWRGNSLDAQIATPLSEVLNPAYVTSDGERDLARRALGHLRRAGTPSEGGLGWEQSTEWTLRVARLCAIVGDSDGAEAALRAGLARHSGAAPIEDSLVLLLSVRAKGAAELEASLRRLLTQQPSLGTARLRLAQLVAQDGRRAEALGLVDQVIEGGPKPRNLSVAARMLVQLGEAKRALAAVAAGTREHPASAELRETHGLLLAGTGEMEAGINELKKAAELDPMNPTLAGHVAALLREVGREEEASEWDKRAKELGQAAGNIAR